MKSIITFLNILICKQYNDTINAHINVNPEGGGVGQGVGI